MKNTLWILKRLIKLRLWEDNLYFLVQVRYYCRIIKVDINHNDASYGKNMTAYNVIYVYKYKNIKIDINEIKLEWPASILRLIKVFRNYIVYTPAVLGRPQRKTTAQKLIKRLSAEKRKLTFGRFSRMTTRLVGVLINYRFVSFIPPDGYDFCTSVCSYWNDYIFYNISRSILRV